MSTATKKVPGTYAIIALGDDGKFNRVVHNGASAEEAQAYIKSSRRTFTKCVAVPVVNGRDHDVLIVKGGKPTSYQRGLDELEAESFCTAYNSTRPDDDSNAFVVRPIGR